MSKKSNEFTCPNPNGFMGCFEPICGCEENFNNKKKMENKLKNLKLKHQLFVGMVGDEFGYVKTYKLLKEAIKAIDEAQKLEDESETKTDSNENEIQKRRVTP